MCHSIDFDNELAMQGYEIHDVSINGMLPSKFPISESTIS